MKTTKSLLYGLLLVTGLVACSKEYNSNPAGNANAFGGTNPIAPITGAAAGEMVFKENGTTVRIKGALWTDDGQRRRITGILVNNDATTTSYSLEFRYYVSGQKEYYGKGKLLDSFFVGKAILNTANPALETTVQYYSGALPVDVSGYCYGKLTDTANNILKGEFSGRAVRRNISDPQKDFGSDFIDITSGFFNASKFEP